MEVNTTMTVCPNGHHYDSAKYSSCPRCGAGSAANFPKTEDVSSPAVAANYESGEFSHTQPVYGVNVGYMTEPADGAKPFKPTMPVQEEQNLFPPTVFAPGYNSDIPPVVGWLVCIEGESKGRDYRLHHEYNSIGREKGDIVIEGDNSISRENQARILYSRNKFFFSHYEGKTSEDINGEIVLTPRELHSYDIISIGSTKLMFVAFCGEKFEWPGETDENA